MNSLREIQYEMGRIGADVISGANSIDGPLMVDFVREAGVIYDFYNNILHVLRLHYVLDQVRESAPQTVLREADRLKTHFTESDSGLNSLIRNTDWVIDRIEAQSAIPGPYKARLLVIHFTLNAIEQEMRALLRSIGWIKPE